MSRIHLYMCSFLVSFQLCSSSTTTTLSPSPSATASISNLTPSQAGQTATVTPASNETGIQSTATESVKVTNFSNIQIAPSSSVNVTLSTSVAPGTQATTKFQARMTVNEAYRSEYDNSSSIEFKAFASNFSKNVENVLRKELSGIILVKVTKLSNGSVVVDFDIVVQESSNASVDAIKQTLEAGNGTELGYTILGGISVNQPSTSSSPSPTTTVTGSTKATEIWDKAIDLATPLGTFIIVVVAVALILILLIVLICVCCKYARLKKKTRFPEHMAINDSEWIRSSDDLLMWERNLRASEVKTTNGVSSRPVNDKRT